MNASGGAIKGAITNGAFGQFNVTGTISSNSTFDNTAATSLLAVSGTGNYTIAGAVTNAGKLASGGGITVAVGGALSAVAGTDNTGDIVNHGGWTGAVKNEVTGTISNTGTWSGNLTDNLNTATANAVNNTGTWTGAAVNHGQLANSGTWTTTAGGFQNGAGGVVNQTAGTIDTGGPGGTGVGGFSNTGTGAGANLAIVNASGGAIKGAITNGAFGQFNVTGTVSSNSTFDNTAATSLLAVSGTGNYTIAGAVTNAGKLASGGGITVAVGGALSAVAGTDNTGDIVNHGGWTGAVKNEATGTISNTGTWSGNLTDNLNTATANAVNNTGTWTGAAVNHGQLANSGTWTTTAGGFQNGAGGVVNQIAGTIDTGGPGGTGVGGFSNTGTGAGANLAIVNASGGAIKGAITNGAFGQFNVTGTVSSNSTFDNTAATSLLAVSGTGNYTVAGNLSNAGNSASGGGISVAAGGILTAANINNTSTGTITNNGTINDALNNAGVVINNGTYNAAVASNTGIITNNAQWNGTLSNTGTVNINPGSVWNAGPGAFTNNSGGTVNASGISTVTAASLVNNGTINLTGAAGSTTVNAKSSALTGGGTITTQLNLNGTGAINSINVASLNAAQNGVINVSGAGATGLFPLVNVAGAGANTGTGTFTGAINPFFAYQYLNPGQGANNTSNIEILVAPSARAATGPLTSILSTISSIDASFHQPGGNLVASPQTDKPCDSPSFPWPSSGDKNCQMVGGPWARVSSGVTTVSSTGSVALNGSIFDTAQSRVRVEFTGVQTGADTGWLNLGGSGVNAHFGITGGDVQATSTELVAGPNQVNFEVPFVGVYGLVTKGPLSTDFTYRHSWYDMHVTNPTALLNNVGFNGQSDNVNGGASYSFRFDNNFFIEPTFNVSYTRSTFDTLPVFNGTSVLGFNTVESLLGRAGARVGTAFSYGGFNWSPFGIALVQHEFMGNAAGTFTGTAAGSPTFDLATTRVGTFYQTSLGLSFQSQTSGLLGFVRGDWRFGDNLHGGGIVGGIRYTFGPS